MTRFLLLFVAFVTVSCANTKKQNTTINKNADSGIVETRLGQTNYYILLPSTFSLEEGRGKEGQLGYNLFPKDPASTMFGTVEIKNGHPVGVLWQAGLPTQETISSLFLSKRVQWNTYVTETGYYGAYINKKGTPTAFAGSKNRNEIDSLISIISTLKQK